MKCRNSGRIGSRLAGLPTDEQLKGFVKKFHSLKLSEIFNHKVFRKIFVREILKSSPRLRRISSKDAHKSKHEDSHVVRSVAKDPLKGGNSAR